MATSATNDRPRVLIYPFSSSGHIITFLDLTDRLLHRGLSATVLVIPRNHPLLNSLLSRHPPEFLEALVVAAPDPPSSHRRHRLVNRLLAMKDHHSPAIIRWFASQPTPPVAIISDFFLGWTHQLACQLGVPRIIYSSYSAAALSLDFSLWMDLPKNEDPNQAADYTVTLPDLPDSPSYPWWQLSLQYRMFFEGNPEMEFHRERVLSNSASYGLIVNTFADLERPFLDHLEKKFYGPGRVWAVGPLLPPLQTDRSSLAERGGSSSVPAGDLLTWLDSLRDQSVVYVCFGSRMVLNSEETHALAVALETSGVHFIWCFREDGTNSGRHTGEEEERGGALPEGFEDRTAGKGLVIRGWGPQTAILRHRAVGSFLTHCGWNSGLEGLANGLVMLTWPMGADQYTNEKMLVDQLGVGIRTLAQKDSPPDPARLARILARSVDGIIPERSRAREMKEAVAAVVSKGGSSYEDLDTFVRTVMGLRSERKEVVGSLPEE